MISKCGSFNTTLVLIKLLKYRCYIKYKEGFNTTLVLIKPIQEWCFPLLLDVSIQLLFLLNTKTAAIKIIKISFNTTLVLIKRGHKSNRCHIPSVSIQLLFLLNINIGLRRYVKIRFNTTLVLIKPTASIQNIARVLFQYNSCSY